VNPEPEIQPAEPPVPPDLVALFDVCLRAGVVDEADRPSLPQMVAIDEGETRELLEGMLARSRRHRPGPAGRGAQGPTFGAKP